jgi:hypothetical protein
LVVITLSSTTAPVLAAALDPEEPEEPDESALAVSLPDEPLLVGADAEEPEPDAPVPEVPEPPEEDEVSALPARAIVVESVALVPLAAVLSSAARRSQPAANIADNNRVNTRAFDVFGLSFMHVSFPDRMRSRHGRAGLAPSARVAAFQ